MMKDLEFQDPSAMMRRRVVMSMLFWPGLGFFMGAFDAVAKNLPAEDANRRQISYVAMGVLLGIGLSLHSWYVWSEQIRTQSGRTPRHLDAPIMFATVGTIIFCVPILMRPEHWLTGNITLIRPDYFCLKTGFISVSAAALWATYNIRRARQIERVRTE